MICTGRGLVVRAPVEDSKRSKEEPYLRVRSEVTARPQGVADQLMQQLIALCLWRGLRSLPESSEATAWLPRAGVAHLPTFGHGHVSFSTLPTTPWPA